ncbi:hypothetical protein ACSTS3_14160 [Aquimarina muelleri]|uniref:hypothetical protein n=1 Tax=Aquimarina muelleri TaxID=279356 RepID=UPI003F682E79
MNKIIILLITLILINCNTNSKKEIELTTKKLDLPLKILYDKKGNDSTSIFLCFPKTIAYNNPTSQLHLIERYNINQHQVGLNNRHYRRYMYKDSLVYAESFKVKPLEKGFVDFYYGYLLKVSNTKLDSLTGGQKQIQQKGNLKIFNIPISKEIKKWAISKINDSIKGQLHFSLHNKEKGFFYKSLDIELFED